MATKTIEQQMIATGKHSSGFDYIRLIFAILIIERHTLLICQGRAAESLTWIGPFRSYYQFLVPVFFALSGFLVAGSLERSKNLISFLVLRVLRIFPALGGEVLISALIIGPFLTYIPLKVYFSNKWFFLYFLNILGDIHYYLPGVFVFNPFHMVNGQLWTVPCDLECYAIITVLAILRIINYPRIFGFCALLFTVFAFYDDWHHGRIMLDSRSTDNMVTATFLWGVFLYLYRKNIPYSFGFFYGALFLTWGFLQYAETVYLATLPAAYITVYMGLKNPKKIFPLTKGDYSYALYLYGFPIQQAVYQLFPTCRVWYLHFPISLFFTSICAYISWTFLESKIMDLKKPTTAYVNTVYDYLRGKATHYFSFALSR